MKKNLLSKALLLSTLVVCPLTSCDKYDFTVGVNQLVQHPALDAATDGFKDALQSKMDEAGKTIKFDVQLAAGEAPNCATISGKFVSKGYDLIMANATASLQSAANATKTIPIVGTSITDYASALGIEGTWTGTVGTNVTGASDLAPLDEQAQMFAELFPTATKVGILYCSNEANSVFQVNKIKEYFTALSITAEEYAFADTNDLTSIVNKMISDKESGKIDAGYVPTDNTAANLSENIGQLVKGKIPFVAGEEGICSGCGVATLSISYYDMGYSAGLMAAEILLNKKDPSKMPIQTVSKDGLTKKYNASMASSFADLVIPSDYVAI